MARWSIGAPALAMALAIGVAPASAQGEAPRIAVFDPEQLWRLSEVGKKYNADLTAARNRLQGDIDKRSQELEGMMDRLRQQQASLSEDKITQMQKEILAKRTERDRMEEDATKEMKFQLNDVQGRFQQMLMQTIDAFGKERNLLLILNRGVIDYSAPQIDVTQDLIAKFNEMHKSTASAGAKPPVKRAPEKPKEPPKD